MYRKRDRYRQMLLAAGGKAYRWLLEGKTKIPTVQSRVFIVEGKEVTFYGGSSFAFLCGMSFASINRWTTLGKWPRAPFTHARRAYWSQAHVWFVLEGKHRFKVRRGCDTPEKFFQFLHAGWPTVDIFLKENPYKWAKGKNSHPKNTRGGYARSQTQEKTKSGNASTAKLDSSPTLG